MSEVWGRSLIDQTDVQLEVDLAELFDGYLVPDSAKLREAIGQEIIDTIRSRTQDDQRSWTGASFANYSNEYAESMDFKAYGKQKDEPNLTQSGDMLGLLTVLDSKDPGKVVVGWDDSLQSEKAHGHITGSVGRKRDFLGLSRSEIAAIKDKFKDELSEIPSNLTKDQKREFDKFLEGKKSIGQKSLEAIIDEFFAQDEEL